MALTQQQFEKFKIVLQHNKEQTGNTLLGIGKTPETAEESDAQLRYLLSTKKISAGVQTNIGDVLSVVEQARTLARLNPEGKFKGLALGIRRPGFLQSKEGRQNRQLVESINLLAQVWASGAALTEMQTKQVMRMTPDKNDTDRQVRDKLNGLINVMYADANGKLKAAGIFGFRPKREDMFAKKVNLQKFNFKF